MSKRVELLIIDPQRSFCADVPADQQQVIHDGELCVPGAWEDFERVAGLIRRLGPKINDIHVTQDSHHPLHIAHPIWFRAVKVNGLATGDHPAPFTSMRNENGVIIGSVFDANTNAFVDIGEFTTPPNFLSWTLHYLQELTNGGRYPHIIWPPHCLIGTRGHQIVEPLYDALHEWSTAYLGYVTPLTKGSNPKVEHFSALNAEVVDPEDPEHTGLNSNFLTTVMEADIILLAGVAGSHCVANTVTDMANRFPDTDEFIKKCTLLKDAISPVLGFEAMQNNFVDAMTKRGMKTTTCADFLS